MGKQKLELTWIGKEQQPRLEPRILLADPTKSYHAKFRVSDQDIFDNRLIFGDNLLALKALEQEFAGKVKCIYIDPPFNIDAATPHYEDNLEHSEWLTLIRNRLLILKNLLSEDGSLFVHIDDYELGYLLVLLDEVMGKKNRVSLITFKQGATTGHKAINPGPVTTANYLLYYAKNKTGGWTSNPVYVAKGRDDRYNQFIVNIHDGYEQWRFITLSEAFYAYSNLDRKSAKKQFSKDELEKQIYSFVLANAQSVVRLARPSYDAVSEEARRLIDVSKENRDAIYLLQRDGFSDMYFAHGERILFYSDKLKLIDDQLITAERVTNIWDDLLSNNLHNEGGVTFPKGKKPEALIKRVLELASNPGDLVLDSFAGSGTTGAVAHKMGRRWIMIELGEHCHTHIIPRMQKVVDGSDQGGISKAVSWKGGGGFRYYSLAPSLLQKDKYGNWVISKEYNAEMLAEAMCKHEGFHYAPDEAIYWKQGQSTETDFVYTTTQPVTKALVDSIVDQLGDRETLLICCTSFHTNADEYPQITVKKIPHAVLARCEFGRDDYSLQIKELEYEPRLGQGELWGEGHE